MILILISAKTQKKYNFQTCIIFILDFFFNNVYKETPIPFSQ